MSLRGIFGNRTYNLVQKKNYQQTISLICFDILNNNKNKFEYNPNINFMLPFFI